MNRPSYYVVICTLVLIAGFAAVGRLGLGPGSPTRGSKAPVVVRLDAPVRSEASQPVEGSVLDTLGFRIVGAEVHSGASRARTDADGHYRLNVRAADAALAALRVAGSGYRPQWIWTSPTAQEPLVVALEPSAPWDASPTAPPAPSVVMGEGQVRDANGASVAGALVFVDGTGACARTDETGHYRIALFPGAATLVVHQPEGGPTHNGLAVRSDAVTVPAGRHAMPLPELVATPAGALRGTVRAADGRPIAGVPVQITGNGITRTIAVGESGAFRLGGLVAGGYQVRAFSFRGAFGTRTEARLDRPVVDLELQLRDAAEQRVQVLDPTGAPVARALVETRVAGLRCAVERADTEGWVHVRAPAPDRQLEVRDGDGYERLRVVDATAAHRIVVSRP